MIRSDKRIRNKIIGLSEMLNLEVGFYFVNKSLHKISRINFELIECRT